MPSVKRPYYLLSGLIIPFWLLIGVKISGFLYPEYSHTHQAMSELGAIGSPVHKISPIINNYPLGLLFIIFGLSITNYCKASKLATTSGGLIILHGLASISAGYFSCDLYCSAETPSTSQKLHNISGLIMFLSLTIANALWLILAKKHYHSNGFLLFSLSCLTVSIISASLLPAAIQQDAFFGLYQRINYGAGVIWLAGLSIMSFIYVKKTKHLKCINIQKNSKTNQNV